MMIKIIITTIIFLALVTSVANAQTVINQQNPDSVVTHKPDTTNHEKQHETPVVSPVASPATTHTQTTVTTRSSITETDAENANVNTNMKIMRHSYKTTGYRIQIYSGGNKRVDRQKCQEIAARLKTRFPDLPIYVHFYSPSWKCRAGNFTSQYEAKEILKQIRAMGYPQACLVKGKINVQY